MYIGQTLLHSSFIALWFCLVVSDSGIGYSLGTKEILPLVLFCLVNSFSIILKKLILITEKYNCYQAYFHLFYSILFIMNIKGIIVVVFFVLYLNHVDSIQAGGG